MNSEQQKIEMLLEKFYNSQPFTRQEASDFYCWAKGWFEKEKKMIAAAKLKEKLKGKKK
jgi:hypothetical protein